MKHTLSGRDERVMMKLVVDGATDRVLGAHMVGADAPEILQALAIALVIRTLLFQPFNIPSGSMIPTLLIGDYVFVSKYAYGYSNYSMPMGPNIFSGRLLSSSPKRGDVVVFKLPRDNETDYIKRVIGLPGDTLELRGQTISINGTPLVEPYAHYLLPADATNLGPDDLRRRFGPVTVPAGHCSAWPRVTPSDLPSAKRWVWVSASGYASANWWDAVNPRSAA